MRTQIKPKRFLPVLLALLLSAGLLIWALSGLETYVFEPAAKARHQSLLTVEEAQALRAEAQAKEKQETTSTDADGKDDQPEEKKEPVLGDELSLAAAQKEQDQKTEASRQAESLETEAVQAEDLQSEAAHADDPRADGLTNETAQETVSDSEPE